MKKANFTEIYNDICSKYGNTLEEERKKLLIGELIIFALLIFGFILCFIFKIEFLIFYLAFLVICITLGVFIFNGVAKKYISNFKTTVIKELIKRTNPTFNYSPKKGFMSKEYKVSGFEKHWDNFYSEDYIEGTIENNTLVRMAQVKTEEEQTTVDSRGNITRTTIVNFLGLYGIMELPISTTKNISIFTNLAFSKFQKNRVDMESAEFEKYYDVFSKDRQGAMELLSNTSIEILNQIRKAFKKPVNIIVNNNYIFFRIECGDIFEPPTFKSSMDFNILYKYFNVIDLPRAIYEALIDNALIINGSEKERLNRIKNNDIE